MRSILILTLYITLIPILGGGVSSVCNRMYDKIIQRHMEERSVLVSTLIDHPDTSMKELEMLDRYYYAKIDTITSICGVCTISRPEYIGIMVAEDHR